MNRARLVLLGIAALGVALLLLVSPDQQTEESTDADGAAVGPGLLDVELATFDGDSVRLETFAAGKPLVMNFFASWCGPCVREMPDFEAVHQRRGGDVRFLGVNLQDTTRAATELVEDTGVTYDVVRDERSELFRAVGGFAMPTTVFLSPDGEVVDVHGGELSQRALESRIDRLLER